MSENKPKVIVLYDGYSRFEKDSYFANCSCTLIKGQQNIIVDTMTAWDASKIIEGLSKHHLSVQDINYVICTHGHSDHIGCNYLFPQALHIVGHSISREHQYFEHDFKSGNEYIINEHVTIIPTPGHTLQDVSVLVQTTEGLVAITGDLFEREEDLVHDLIWKSAGSDSEDLQAINRQKVLQIADFIVPGHGPMFKVNKAR